MFSLTQLPYDYAALEPFIDEATMRVHHDKHHAAYVNNLNAALTGQDKLLSFSVEEILQDLDHVPEPIRTKVRNNGGGVANHNLYWLVMSPNPNLTTRIPSVEFRSVLDSEFGDWAKFQEKFSAAGLGRFGSGWAWLSVANGKLVVEDTANQDSPLSLGHTPILALDVWEHAYYLQYQNLRADYIKAWWNVVNWDEVEKRYRETVK